MAEIYKFPTLFEDFDELAETADDFEHRTLYLWSSLRAKGGRGVGNREFVYSKLALEYIANDRYEYADRIARKILSYSPTDRGAYRIMQAVALHTGNVEAMEDYEKILAAIPEDVFNKDTFTDLLPFYDLDFVFDGRNFYTEADSEDEGDLFTDKVVRAEDKIFEAQIRMALWDYDAAVCTLFDAYLNYGRDDDISEDIEGLFCYCMLASGNEAEADKFILAIKDNADLGLYSYMSLILYYLYKGDAANAETYALKLEKDLNDTIFVANVYDAVCVADVFERTGRGDAAVRTLETLSETECLNPVLVKALAQAYICADRRAEARTLLSAADCAFGDLTDAGFMLRHFDSFTPVHICDEMSVEYCDGRFYEVALEELASDKCNARFIDALRYCMLAPRVYNSKVARAIKKASLKRVGKVTAALREMLVSDRLGVVPYKVELIYYQLLGFKDDNSAPLAICNSDGAVQLYDFAEDSVAFFGMSDWAFEAYALSCGEMLGTSGVDKAARAKLKKKALSICGRLRDAHEEITSPACAAAIMTFAAFGRDIRAAAPFVKYPPTQIEKYANICSIKAVKKGKNTRKTI